MHLRNAPTRLMKELDYGKGYRYAHDEEGGFAAGESYLPDGIDAPAFYRPVERGLEIRIAEKLRELRKRNATTQRPSKDTACAPRAARHANASARHSGKPRHGAPELAHPA